MSKCNICGHEMSTRGLYLDCGGDCMICMANVGEDPHCIDSIIKLATKYHQMLELVKNNLYRGMSHSIQRVQAKSIEEVLLENAK